MKRYNPKELEPKWQQQWSADKIYEADDSSDKPKKYVLEYFPYPSGAAMHVGHVRNYTIGDAIVRYSRMRGYNVLYAMGWDAFGLPAENYAIKHKISPRTAIDENTARFKEQLIQMGFSYDWSREIDSTDPKYYRWTQWFFLMLFKRGLAYQKDSLQWWCPVDKTVLANEQVEAGLCWRCGNVVEKKLLKQWFFKITDYADRLVDDLEDLNWSESIKSMQRNWIGKSTGVEVSFAIDGSSEALQIFTTRPDTLFGATFMVLAPEHPLVKTITTAAQESAVSKYVKASIAKSDIQRQETDRQKTGVFTGAYAINPANDEKIAIWVADYVLMGYGTGAIMAVPAHDERDFEFARTFDLPVRQVIAETFIHTGNEHKPGVPVVERRTVCMVVKHPDEDKILMAKPKNSDYWSSVMGGIDKGESIEAAAKRELIEESGLYDIKTIKVHDVVFAAEFYAQHKKENRIAYPHTVVIELNSLKTQKISDEEKESQHLEWMTLQEARSHWVGASGKEILDQAFGIPIPMTFEGRLINSKKYDGMSTSEAREKIVADLVDKKQAQEVTNYKIRDWLISRQRYWGAPIPIIHCPKDGAVAVPDDQLPVKVPEIESYEPTGDGRSPLANVPEFVNTTCPKCGGPAERETDTMDGFACSSWYFLRFADPHNDNEPFSKEKAKLWLPVDDYIGGAEHAVMHLLYARFWTKVMFDAGLIDFQEPFLTLRNHGMILAPDGVKMSKSKGNTIEPSTLIDQGYGADSIRVMELFLGPWDQVANWSVEGMGGCFRFLQRIWTLAQEYQEADRGTIDSPELTIVMHQTIAKVSRDLEKLGFNTAISALMEFVNNLYKIKAKQSFEAKQWPEVIATLVQLLAPFAPHISEELWHQLGNKSSIHTSEWPVHDRQYLISDTVKVVVQVNGKVRATIDIKADSNETTVAMIAKKDDKVAGYLKGQTIKKTIFVKNRLINFVV